MRYQNNEDISRKITTKYAFIFTIRKWGLKFPEYIMTKEGLENLSLGAHFEASGKQ